MKPGAFLTESVCHIVKNHPQALHVHLTDAMPDAVLGHIRKYRVWAIWHAAQLQNTTRKLPIERVKAIPVHKHLDPRYHYVSCIVLQICTQRHPSKWYGTLCKRSVYVNRKHPKEDPQRKCPEYEIMECVGQREFIIREESSTIKINTFAL